MMAAHLVKIKEKKKIWNLIKIPENEYVNLYFVRLDDGTQNDQSISVWII